MSITACERVLHEPVDGVLPSDHYGVLADLAIRAIPMPDTSHS